MSNYSSLTPYENQIIINSEFLLAKNAIIKKVINLFGHLSEGYTQHAKNHLPPDYLITPPKISRGEQYLGLPYVMLDYPRNFTKQDSLAIRTFFWWGHFFSIHLHLTGKYQQQFAPAVIKALHSGQFEEWYIGVSKDEWSHHFGEDNYQPIENGALSTNLVESPFIKLAQKIPLTEWDNAEDLLKKCFTLLCSSIAN